MGICLIIHNDFYCCCSTSDTTQDYSDFLQTYYDTSPYVIPFRNNNDGGKNGTTSVENSRSGYDNEKEIDKKESTISSNNRYKRIRDTNNSAIGYESDLQKSVQDFVVGKDL